MIKFEEASRGLELGNAGVPPSEACHHHHHQQQQRHHQLNYHYHYRSYHPS